MDNPKEENEKLIGKLIRKRKQENAAFKKLLTAIHNKALTKSQTEKKSKS